MQRQTDCRRPAGFQSKGELFQDDADGKADHVGMWLSLGIHWIFSNGVANGELFRGLAIGGFPVPAGCPPDAFWVPEGCPRGVQSW